MNFRISRSVKNYFDNIIDGRNFLQFDVYYPCALIGMAMVQIDDKASDFMDMTDEYPLPYREYKAHIAGLLVATEAKRRNIEATSEELEKAMLEYLAENETLLSDRGVNILNAYSYKGAMLYMGEAVDAPRNREDFLLLVDQTIKKHEEETKKRYA